MATIENNGLMVYKDEDGNNYVLYPITKVDLIDGLDEHLDALLAALGAKKADLVHAARHASGGADPITPEAIGAALANLSNVPADAIGAAITAAGGAKIETGGYTGVENTKQVLTFSFAPKVVIIAPDVTSTNTCKASPLVAFPGGVGAPVYSSGVQKYSLVGNTLTLEATSASASYTWTAPYRYVAIG